MIISNRNVTNNRKIILTSIYISKLYPLHSNCPIFISNPISIYPPYFSNSILPSFKQILTPKCWFANADGIDEKLNEGIDKIWKNVYYDQKQQHELSSCCSAVYQAGLTIINSEACNFLIKARDLKMQLEFLPIFPGPFAGFNFLFNLQLSLFILLELFQCFFILINIQIGSRIFLNPTLPILLLHFFCSPSFQIQIAPPSGPSYCTYCFDQAEVNILLLLVFKFCMSCWRLGIVLG